MGNIASIAMGLGNQEEEEEVVAVMVSEEEESAGDEEQQEEPQGGAAEAEGDVEREEQDDARDVEREEEQTEAAVQVQCSICLDAVVAGGGERSTARLQCGHEFHLDCIGSAFNSKGSMQCPNCRRIEETGNWLFARGPVSPQHVNNDDRVFDEDLDGSAPTVVFVPLRLRVIPIAQLASEFPSLYDEIQAAQTAAFHHDAIGQNSNTEPTAVAEPGTSYQGSYVAYSNLQSLPPPESSSSTHVVEGAVDDWNPLAGPSNGQLQDGVHPIDFYHNLLEQMHHFYSPPNNNNGLAEQSGIPVGTTRTGGVDDNGNQPTEETSNDS